MNEAKIHRCANSIGLIAVAIGLFFVVLTLLPIEPVVDCERAYQASQIRFDGRFTTLRSVPECPGVGLVDVRAFDHPDWRDDD